MAEIFMFPRRNPPVLSMGEIQEELHEISMRLRLNGKFYTLTTGELAAIEERLKFLDEQARKQDKRQLQH